MTLDLHQHAGHVLVIGHPSPRKPATETVLWCDTCDVLVLGIVDATSCIDNHETPKPHYRPSLTLETRAISRRWTVVNFSTEDCSRSLPL